MIFRIPKGKHYSRPWRLGLWWKRTHFTWVVKFTDSCRYDMGNDDQGDTNKLCGIGYLPSHHKDSARFGWLYNIEHNEIDIIAYCYVDGNRIIKYICSVEIGKTYKICLVASTSNYFLSVDSSDTKGMHYVEVPHCHRKKLKFGLWPYFGGNQKAPRDIEIALKRS